MAYISDTKLGQTETMALPTSAYESWDIVTKNPVDGTFEENIQKILSHPGATPWREIDVVPPSMAVPVMNVIQKVVDATTPNETRYTVSVKCLLALSRARNTFPDSFLRHHITTRGNYPFAGGGHSDIWLGDMDGKAVCLKVLRTFSWSKCQEDECLKDLCREALVWRQLRHENILPFCGIDSEYFTPRYCLISPWMKNGNIVNYLESHPEHDRFECVSEIARAIEFLHGLDPQVVHGDIRGCNVLVSDDFHCCLADFGSTISIATEAPSCNTMSQNSTRWLAPELLVYDPMSFDKEFLPGRDIYAFGCTIIEIFTLKPPFSHILPAAILYRIYNGERHPRPSLEVFPSDELWKLVEQCMSIQPRDRPSAGEVRLSIDNIVH